MRIMKFALHIFSRIIASAVAAAITAAIALISLSGPYIEPPAEIPAPPPRLEELIPEGARKDKDALIRVLSEGETTTMPLERYLIGAVAAEMPAMFELDALKAQAVAARTLVLYRLLVEPNPNHPEAEVCTDPGCCIAFTDDWQLRENWDDDYVRNINRIIGAVLDTDGIYVSYRGEPILPLFHSSSLGTTEASGNVWGSDLPYLVSVDSPETTELVPDLITSVTFTKTEFREMMENAIPGIVFGADEESWIEDVSYTENGRISHITVGGQTINGTELRSALGLRSTAAVYAWESGNIKLTVAGFGHGVGMSQYGANIMATEKISYRMILTHYYTDVDLLSER